MQEVLNAAIETWGTDLQQIVAIEECSEVAKEICKYIMGKFNKLHMAEEIADLQIVLGQLEIIHGRKKERSTYPGEFQEGTILHVLDDVSYTQLIITGIINGSKSAQESIVDQVNYTYASIEWLKKELDIEKLVDVYVKRKIDRLKERINEANQS